MKLRLAVFAAVLGLLFAIPVQAQQQSVINLTANLAQSVSVTCNPLTASFGIVAPGGTYTTAATPVTCVTTWFLSPGMAVYQVVGTGGDFTGSAGTISATANLFLQDNGGPFVQCNQNFFPTTYGWPALGLQPGRNCGPNLNGNLSASQSSGTKTDTLVFQLTVPPTGLTVGTLTTAAYVDVAFQ